MAGSLPVTAGAGRTPAVRDGFLLHSQQHWAQLLLDLGNPQTSRCGAYLSVKAHLEVREGEDEHEENSEQNDRWDEDLLRRDGEAAAL